MESGCDSGKSPRALPQSLEQEQERQRKWSMRSESASNPWMKDEHNPDHKLAVIYAANKDFQSKCKVGVGSYLIHLLFTALTRNATQCHFCCGPQYLSEIMNQKQKLLEEHGKQLPVALYTNETEHIVFAPNSKSEHGAGVQMKSHIELRSAASSDLTDFQSVGKGPKRQQEGSEALDALYETELN